MLSDKLHNRSLCGALFLFLVSTAAVWGDVNGADPRLTGAPGDGNCTQCHSGTQVNAGGGSVKIILPGDATYTPGVNQHIKVQVSDSAQRRWGFELSARVDSNPTSGQAGALASTDSFTQVLCDNGRRAPCANSSVIQFITHTNAGTHIGTSASYTFEFDWTPPATDVGPVTLYAAGNAANGNNANSGDHIYTASTTLTAAVQVPKPSISSANGVTVVGSRIAGAAPATWLAINGTNLANSSRTWTLDEVSAGSLPTSLDGVSVQINGNAAFVQSISPTKLIVLSPSDSTVGPVNVVVTNNGIAGDASIAAMAAMSPSLFVTSDGKYLISSHGGNPLASRLDNVPSAALPDPTAALPGETIAFYGTGFGPADPAIVDGQLQQSPANIATSPLTVTVGGSTATVVYAGLATGFAAVFQLEIAVPVTVSNGDQEVVVSFNDQTYTSKIQITGARPKPTINSTNGVTITGSQAAGAAPQTWITINGANLANSTRSWTTDEVASGQLPISLDGVSVQINGADAFVQSVSPAAVVVLSPNDATVGPVNVAVTNNGLLSDSASVTMAGVAPALFTADGKYLVTSHGDSALADRIDNFPSTAAKLPAPVAAQPGEAISFYGTGFGVTDPALADGQLQKDPANLTTPITITVGVATVNADFAGLVPGMAGIYQFKVTIPTDTADGDQQVTIQMNDLSTQKSDKCCFVQVKAATASPVVDASVAKKRR